MRLERLIEELSKEPGRAFRGKLAEDYDGIGQYVLVSLSLASTSAAYKVRVAAGDFNTSRFIPRGTPVSVFAYRGQLEVLLGGRPGCPCDKFNREVPLTEPPQWGTGPYGKWLNNKDLIETYVEPSDDNNADYVTNGEGILSYHDPLADVSMGDPVMGLKFNHGITIPAQFDIKFRFDPLIATTPTLFTEGSLVFYAAPFYHFDWNAWASPAFSIYHTAGSSDWKYSHYWSVLDEGPYVWPSSDFPLQESDIPATEADALANWYWRIRIDNTGCYSKIWNDANIPLPGSWTANMIWTSSPPPDPMVMYRTIFIESQSFLYTTPLSPLPVYFDKFCIDPCPREKSAYIAPPAGT